MPARVMKPIIVASDSEPRDPQRGDAADQRQRYVAHDDQRRTVES